jgi:hypothetical protein
MSIEQDEGRLHSLELSYTTHRDDTEADDTVESSKDRETISHPIKCQLTFPMNDITTRNVCKDHPECYIWALCCLHI